MNFSDDFSSNNYDTSKTLSLISLIHSKAECYLNEELKKKGLPNLSTSHGFILYNLSVKKEMTMGEITQKINRDKSTTTALVKKLVSLGYVEECRDCQDSRLKIIKLTPKGMSFNSATNEISKDLQERCLRGLTQEEAMILSCMLHKIKSNF